MATNDIRASRPWLTYASLGLWVMTIVFGSYFFVFGRTTASVDGRIAVVLSPTEREFVLNEMRSLVVGLNGVMDGLAKEDNDAIAASLSSMGMVMAADDSEVLLGKLPLGLKKMGLGLHRKMDVLADQVSKGELTQKQLFGELSASLATCVSCHATYRVVAAETLSAN
jgi:hypothetical protein